MLLECRFQYNDGHTVYTDSLGHETLFYYNENMKPTRAVYENGRVDTYRYNDFDEMAPYINGDGEKTTYSYNLGNLLKESQDDHYIEIQYPTGNDIGTAGITSMTSGRVGFQSSMGLDVDIQRDKFGQVEGMSAIFQDDATWKSQMAYNMLGQVEERVLNGAVKDEWSYDPQGRPLSQRVSGNWRESSHRKYQWDIGDQLTSIVDRISHMSLSYSYDSYGILESETCHGVRTLDKPYLLKTVRKLDDSGNVYETKNKSSRRYGKGGQLESISSRQYSEIPEHLLGTTYRYNDCGEMIEKKDANGKKWRYIYHPGGLLEKVIPPDGQELCFAYDPLGRRISKSFDGKTTRFLWDRNKILHEWVEGENTTVDAASSPITWLFNDNTFTPFAKLANGQSYDVITDHLGTPSILLNQKGKAVWKSYFDIYGRARVKEGGVTEEENCSFRFPGQYEDTETGLYYNRFRYYMPDVGIYTQSDPIGLAGGNPTVYGYVWNTLVEIDLFGLHQILAMLDGVHIPDPSRRGARGFYWQSIIGSSNAPFNGFGATGHSEARLLEHLENNFSGPLSGTTLHIGSIGQMAYDSKSLWSTLPPCPSCQIGMIEFASRHDLEDIIYTWEVEGVEYSWRPEDGEVDFKCQK